MNILIDARPLCIPHPGGITRVTRQLLDELFQTDTENTYTLTTTGWQKPTLPWSEDRRHRHLHRTCPNKIVSGLASFNLTSLRDWFPDERPDLIFLPNIGFIGRLKTPYVLLVHDLTFLTEPRWYSLRGRLWHHAVHAKQLIERATRLVTISQYVKQELERQLAIPSERITVLSYKPNVMGSVKTLPAVLENKRFILCLGAGDRRKNAEAILSAWQELRRKNDYKEVECVLVGRQEQKFSLSGLHLLERPTDDALATLYKHASVFCYPSWSEGYGIPLHEAARFGIPCIAASGSALEETAPEGTLFVPPEKPHLLTSALEMQLIQPRITQSQDRLSVSTQLLDVFRKY